jgi:hypothetical protein
VYEGSIKVYEGSALGAKLEEMYEGILKNVALRINSPVKNEAWEWNHNMFAEYARSAR